MSVSSSGKTRRSRRSSACLSSFCHSPSATQYTLPSPSCRYDSPSWPAHAWLVVLALTSQVLGWLLIGASLPRLPAAIASLLLTLQPVGSIVLGVIIFGESPTALQLTGVAAILSGLVLVAAMREPARPPAYAAAEAR